MPFAMFKKILVGKTDHLHLQFFRYLFVGGAAAAADTAMVVYFANVLGTHYQLAVVLGFCLGIVINYVLSHGWVFGKLFRGRKTGDHIHDILLFAMIGIIGLLLTMLLMWLFHQVFGFSVLVSKLLSLVVVFWNFLARKYLVFGRQMNNHR